MRGSWRANARRSEPEPKAGEPAPTKKLTPSERAIWDNTVAILRQMQVLTVADGEALTRYCRLVGKFNRERDINRMLKIDAALSRLSRQFGLNPAARATLRVNDASQDKSEKKQDKGRFFGGPRLAAG